ncbi:MAG: hypothetical protein KAR06_12185 [Deltaproteobacteria bacterium]|nr:hypothetical protein [Deltaproteobacteria bacterium]
MNTFNDEIVSRKAKASVTAQVESFDAIERTIKRTAQAALQIKAQIAALRSSVTKAGGDADDLAQVDTLKTLWNTHFNAV